MNQKVKSKHQTRATYVALFVLLELLVVVCFALPAVLPRILHLVIGLLISMVAAAAAIFASLEFIVVKQRAIQMSRIFGTLAFLIVIVWWLSSFSPLKVSSTSGRASISQSNDHH